MGFLLGLLPYLAAGLALFGAYRGVQNWCNDACKDARAETVAAVNELADYKAQQARIVAAMSAAWDKTRQESDSHARETEQARAAQFTTLEERAKAVAATGGLRFSAGAIRVFDDARAAASAPAAGPAAKPAEAAPAPAGSAEEYVVALHAWIGVCRDRVSEWEQFYKGLQDGSARTGN